MDPISIEALGEGDVPEAERVRRVAFGTLLGLPNPEDFGGDSAHVRCRRLIDPSSAFVAKKGGRVVGSNFATRWGSVGFFGPLSVHPDLWDQAVGQRLMEPVLELFDRWETRLVGLFTFAESPKHIGLYQKFGFRPRFLTALLVKPVTPFGRPAGAGLFSEMGPPEREALLAEARSLTDSLHEGLDPTIEVVAAEANRLGDTVLVRKGSELTGMAVCHVGPGTEAGTGTCYVKFGAVRPGPAAARDFSRLLDACEAFAAERRCERLTFGVNTARSRAYGYLLARGYRIARLGVAMHRPDEPGYSRPGIYCLDDWR